MEEKCLLDFNAKKGFICDMDGVIYHGNKILPGVVEFIQWLQAENKRFLFLTNNSGYTPKELHQKLARMGLDVSEDHFYTSALATAAFLKEQAPGCSVFAIGEAGLCGGWRRTHLLHGNIDKGNEFGHGWGKTHWGKL